MSKGPETREFDGLAKRRVRVRMTWRFWTDVMVWAATPAEAAQLAQAGQGSHAGQCKPELVGGEVVWGPDDDGKLIQLDRTAHASEAQGTPGAGDAQGSGLIKVV